MSLLDRLERIFGRVAIPNISLYFVIGQVAVLLGFLLGVVDLRNFLLFPVLVQEGEWWRLFSFLLFPPPPGMFGYIFIAFAWYMFYLMGTALEHYWGTFRYNLFLFLGWGLAVGAAFITPQSAATNAFLAGSVFLAFAYLNPDFEIALFLILPIKIKWLALLTWVLYAVSFIRGGTATRLQIAASVGNFFLFFAHDIWLTIRHRQRSMAGQVRKIAEEKQPRHICHVCGKTDRSNPEMDFRYCSKCAGDQCYCPDHIHNHAHVVAAEDRAAR
jgi:hypothetical protein